MAQFGFTETHSSIPVIQQALPVAQINSQNQMTALPSLIERAVLSSRLCVGTEYHSEGLRVAVCLQSSGILLCQAHYSKTGTISLSGKGAIGSRQKWVITRNIF
jgi:hypothetical protein